MRQVSCWSSAAVQKIRETKNNVTFVIDVEHSKNINGEFLFMKANDISKFIRFTYKENHLNIILDTIKLKDGEKITYGGDLNIRRETIIDYCNKLNIIPDLTNIYNSYHYMFSLNLDYFLCKTKTSYTTVHRKNHEGFVAYISDVFCFLLFGFSFSSYSEYFVENNYNYHYLCINSF